ncbi:MAG: hypothetical protein J5441_04570 [Clostridia bacterium]|nr:hypothetical protein [Clostridia bacterium]
MKLAEIFCDGMVLQRDREIRVFGSGKGEGKVDFLGRETRFTADGGFVVTLPAASAGGPYEMRVTLGGEEAVIRDILVGDVYLASGQSNMALLLGEIGQEAYAETDAVRYFKEPHFPDDNLNPWLDFKGWEKCGKEASKGFSAVAYYFAAKLNAETGVPVGIVCSSIGASTVDAWTSPEVVNTPEYQALVAVRHNDFFEYKFNQNCWLYRHKLQPLIPYSFAGALWYQGESDRRVEEARNYDKMLAALINDWRGRFGYELPFYCVQIMPFNEPESEPAWAVIREGIEKASKSLDKTYMVTLFNTGEADNIHPTKKRGVGEALANAVLCRQFGREVEYCGPVLEAVSVADGEAKLTFSHADGLRFEGAPRDVYALLPDGEAPAECAIADGAVFVKLPPDAAGVSMGFRNAPEHNLYNSSGYLASPFRYCFQKAEK